MKPRSGSFEMCTAGKVITKIMFGVVKTFVADGELNGSIDWQVYNNRYYLPDQKHLRKYFETLEAFVPHEKDIFLCSYPKSGLHWQWEVVSMIIKQQRKASEKLLSDFHMDFTPASKLQMISPPRILASHFTYDQLPKDILQKKCKIINIVRDPRAVAVSCFHFYTKNKTLNWKGDWNGFYNLFTRGIVYSGDWFSFTKSWEHFREKYPDYPVFTINYEDVSKDPFEEYKRLAHFLGANVSDSFLRTIIEETSISRMTSSKQAGLSSHVAASYFEGNKYPVFRKGSIDDWKEYFTLRENENFEELFKEKMKSSKTNLKSLVFSTSTQTGCVEIDEHKSKL